MPNSKKILIVSYQLPPYGSIGGRRWTKFGKYLLAKGYDVRFLTPQRKAKGDKKWESDYNIIKDRIVFFKTNYPASLQRGVNSLKDKIAYRLALSSLKNKEKGNYFDPSCLDKKSIQEAVSKQISEGYDIVISTGAPFLQLHHLTELRVARADFKLIIDVRDPWTMQDWSYGFPSLSDDRIAVEKTREKFVMENADQVVTVLPRMTKDFGLLAPEKGKFHTVYNGFDQDDYDAPNVNTPKKNDKIKFIFAGNFYDSATHHITDLVSGLSALKSAAPETYAKCEFDFYGRAPEFFHNAIANEPAIKHHGFIPSDTVSEKLMNADVALLFLIDGFNYSLSTKFFEYIAVDKPIMMFAKSGDSTSFIKDNEIGWHFESEKVEVIFNEILKLKESNALDLNADFDKNQFTLENITNQIESVIKQVVG